MLSIFTPTYNRVDKLSRLFESLMNQTVFDFEWLIVDDGSTDNTENLIKQFQSQNKFPIIYYKQQNGGKHTAYNKALTLARGDFFFCVDSDDWLKEDAIGNLLSAISQINENQFIVAYKSDSSGALLSNTFPQNCKKTTLQQLSEQFGCRGEFSLVFPTKLVRQFPFPIFKNEKFVTESVVYDQINNVANILLLPQVLTICEYQPEGLSYNLNKIMKQNPAGYCLYFMQRIDMQKNFKNKIATAGKYNCFKIFAKSQKSIYNGEHKLLVFLSKPVGILFWFYYKLFRNF